MPSFNQTSFDESRTKQQQINIKNCRSQSYIVPLNRKQHQFFSEIQSNTSSFANLTFKTLSSSIISPSEYQTNDNLPSEQSNDYKSQYKTISLSQNQISNELSQSNPLQLIFGKIDQYKFIQQALEGVNNNLFQSIFEIEKIGKQFLNFELKTFDQKQQLQIDQILILYFLFGFITNYFISQDYQFLATFFKQFIAMVGVGLQIFNLWVLEYSISTMMVSIQIMVHILVDDLQQFNFFSQIIINLLPFFILLLLCLMNQTIMYYSNQSQEFSKLIYLVLNEKFQIIQNQCLIKCKIQEKNSNCIFYQKFNSQNLFDQYNKTFDNKIQKTNLQYVQLLQTKDSLQNLLQKSSFTFQQSKEVIETISQQNETFQTVKKEIGIGLQKFQLQFINLGQNLGTYFVIFQDQIVQKNNSLNIQLNVTDIYIKPFLNPQKPDLQKIIKQQSQQHTTQQKNDLFQTQTLKLQQDENFSQKTPSLNQQSCNTSVTMLDIGKNCLDPTLLDSNTIDNLDINSQNQKNESIYTQTLESPYQEKEEQYIQQDQKIENLIIKEPENQIEFLRQELKNQALNANNLRFNMLEKIIESNDEESKGGMTSMKSIQSYLSNSASGELSQGYHLSQKMPDAFDQTDSSLSGDDTNLQGIQNMQIEMMSSKVNLENGIRRSTMPSFQEKFKEVSDDFPQVLPKSQFTSKSIFEQDYSFSRDINKDNETPQIQQIQNKNNLKKSKFSKFQKDNDNQYIKEFSKDSLSSAAGQQTSENNLENIRSVQTFDLLNSSLSLANLVEIQSHQSNTFIHNQNEDDQSPLQTEYSQIGQKFLSKKSSQEKTISAFSNQQRNNNLMDDDYDAVSCYTSGNQLKDQGLGQEGTSGQIKRRQSTGFSENLQNVQYESNLQVNRHISAQLRRHSVKVLKDFHVQVTFSKLEAIRQERNELQKKIKTLEKQLNNNKIFLNMVIHDMRSPSTSAEFGLKQCLKTISLIQQPNKQELEMNFSQKLQDFLSVIINAFTKFEEQKLQKRQFTPLVTKNQDSVPEQKIISFRPASGLSAASYNLSFRSQSPAFEKSQVSQRLEKKSIDVQQNVFNKFKIQLNRSDSSVSLDRGNKRCNSGMSLENLYNIRSFLDFQFQTPQSLIVRPFGPQAIENDMKNRLIKQKELKVSNVLDNYTQTSDHTNFQIIEHNNQNLQQEILGALNQLIDEFTYIRQKQVEKAQENNQKILNNLENLERNSHHALHSIQLNLNLINDLLDLAKLENNKFSLNQEFFCIINVIEQAFETMKFQANLKKVGLNLVFHDEQTAQKIQQFLVGKKNDSQTESLLRMSQITKNQKEKWNKKLIFGDQRRYLQILLNFLSNALKFTNKEGWIKVHLGILESQEEIMRRNSLDDLDSEQENEIQKNFELPRSITINNIYSSKTKKNFEELFVKFYMMIEDSGVGISQHNIKNLFLNFGKLEEHDSMNTAGTGLGLSICKQLIEQMAGEVYVESKINVGTAFILVFTSKKRQINDDQYSQSFTSGQIRKKLAQELTLNSKISSLFSDQKTQKKQVSPSKNTNSGGTKTLVQQSSQETKFSGKILRRQAESFNMKGKSNNERTLKVSSGNNNKQLSQFSQSILAGLSDSGDSQNSKEELHKISQNLPNSSKIISNESQIDFQQNKQRLINSNQNSNKKKYRVLVVNDNIIQLMCTKIILEEYCYEIVEAQNGYEAYQIIKNTYFSPEKKKTLLFDFVLMDLDMPIMNGWQACKNIRTLMNDDHSLFKVTSNSQESQYQHKEQRLDTSYSNDLRDFINSSVTSKKNNLYIFAYSSLITQEIELKALQAGFTKCIDAPLQVATLKKEIIEFIESDRLLKRNKDNSLAQFDDISSLYSLNIDDKQSMHAFSSYSRYKSKAMRKNDVTTSMINIPSIRWSPQLKDELQGVTRGYQKVQNGSRLNEIGDNNFLSKVQVQNHIKDEKNAFITQDSIPRIMTKNEELSSQILDRNLTFQRSAGRNFVRRQSLFAQNVRKLDLLNPSQEQFKSFKEDQSLTSQQQNQKRKNSQPQIISRINRQDSEFLEEVSSNNSQMGYAFEEKPIEEEQKLEFGRLLLPNRQRQRLIQDFKRDFIEFK